jgi:hypothetical protein
VYVKMPRATPSAATLMHIAKRTWQPLAWQALKVSIKITPAKSRVCYMCVHPSMQTVLLSNDNGSTIA